MKIELKEVSKRYTQYWVLKKINFSFASGEIYGIKGQNGSGKSTLMQILAGQLSSTLGEVLYFDDSEQLLDRSAISSRFSFSAPYIFPIQNLSLLETISFHCLFRKFREGVNAKAFVDLLDYPFQTDQYVKYYSSGMMQRLSLALTILTEANVILLDEPGSYLDEKGVKWYHELLNKYRGDSTVIISSNDPEDLAECSEFLEL